MDVDTYLLTNIGEFDADPWKELRELVENGLGFQFIKIPREPWMDDEEIPSGEYLVFNCEFFFPIRGLEISILSTYFAAYPSYHAFIRSLKPKPKTRARNPASITPSPPGTLIMSTFTTAGEVYWRLSAYPNDRRDTPDNQIVKGTYVTTKSDIEVVGSGFAAVGRYALPTPFPSVYAFAIRPDPGTPIDLGTVRPNYGQSGGGVEGVFDKDTGPWTVANHKRALPAW
jgi:hypothetical protein